MEHMKESINQPLNRYAARTNTPQKFFAFAAKLGRSTINNYFHGTKVRPNEAVDIANAMNDTEMTYQMAHLFLGVPKLFTGDGMYHDLRGLLYTDKREEAEEKQAFVEQDVEALANDPDFRPEDAKHLKTYAFEKLDSTVADLTELSVICQQLNMSLMDLFAQRMPYYKRKKYMKEDEDTWKSKD